MINATSIGLYPHVHDRLDVDIDSLRPSMVVADVIPNHLVPISSKMLKRAVARLLMGSACSLIKVLLAPSIGLESMLTPL